MLLSSFIGPRAEAIGVDDLSTFEPELEKFGLTLQDVAAVISGAKFLYFNLGEGAVSGFQVTDLASAESLVEMVGDYGLDSIGSSITGNSLYGGNTSSVICSGSSGSHEITTLDGAIDCLGLRTAFASFQAANAVNEIQNIGFYFNRPTTVIANSLAKIRLSSTHTGNSSGLKGGASGDVTSITDDLSFYFGAGGSFGDVNNRRGFAGYGLDHRETTVGLDYRINDAISSGVLFNYASIESDIAGGVGNFYSDVFRFSPYLSIRPTESSFIDIAAGYGLHDNEANRNCLGCSAALTSDYKSDEYFASLNLGYSFNFDALTLTGYAGASAMYMDFGAYREKGADAIGNGLIVNRSFALSLTHTLGVKLLMPSAPLMA